MKVMVIVKATAASEAGEMPSTELLTEMGKFNQELAKSGIMLDASGLTPSSRGARVHFSGANRTVVDGPFAETKELIAGFWIWKVKSLQEAIDWVKKCPNPMLEDSDIEIRPFFEMEDFGEALTPDLKDQFATTYATSLGLNLSRFVMDTDRTIAGLNVRYTMESRIEIPQQWEKFVPRAASLPAVRGSCFYGVCWNTDNECRFDYLTGLEVTDSNTLPAEFTKLKLVGRKYAVFAHTDHVSRIPQTIDLIWTKWVNNCGLQIAKAPCFERYTSEFNPGTGMGGMEIWIPLDA